jgi:cell division protein FtsW (lipid II flippase)
MQERTAAAMAFFGLLLTFGAVGGMEDPAKVHYFWEQVAVAVLGLGLMWVAVLRLRQG